MPKRFIIANRHKSLLIFMRNSDSWQKGLLYLTDRRVYWYLCGTLTPSKKVFRNSASWHRGVYRYLCGILTPGKKRFIIAYWQKSLLIFMRNSDSWQKGFFIILPPDREKFIDIYAEFCLLAKRFFGIMPLDTFC